MNTARKGNAAEVYVARWLERHGWIVGSRRHIGGAGDLLAVRDDRVQLVEVKCCKNLWQQFRRADRQAMKDVALPEGGERWVVNKRGKELVWVPESRWP